MAIYEKTPDHHNGTLSHKVKERYIYGSNRVGTYTEEKEMIGASTINTTFSHPLGARHYELTNHLGNILAVVSDAPIKADTNADHLRDYNLPPCSPHRITTPLAASCANEVLEGIGMASRGKKKTTS